MTIITEFAPAKVNLTLEVLGRRPDGFHEIASLVAFASAGDQVTLDTSRPLAVTTSGRFDGSIAGQNLIEVTLQRLREAEPRLTLGAVNLEKNLPVAAGIGGGSADAAAVLRAVRTANPDLAAIIDWSRIAASLGADVPVCFANRAAWMTGIGEVVQPVAGLPPLAAVLVNPLLPMPSDKTAQVFRNLNAGPLESVRATPPTAAFATTAALLDFISSRGNALDTSARRVAPVINDVMGAISTTPGCLYAAVSGGGPTCFGIFTDNTVAAAAITQDHPTWWIVPVVLR